MNILIQKIKSEDIIFFIYEFVSIESNFYGYKYNIFSILKF